MNIDAHIYKTRDGKWRARMSLGAAYVYTRSTRSIAALAHQICVIVNEHEKRINKGRALESEASE